MKRNIKLEILIINNKGFITRQNPQFRTFKEINDSFKLYFFQYLDLYKLYDNWDYDISNIEIRIYNVNLNNYCIIEVSENPKINVIYEDIKKCKEFYDEVQNLVDSWKIMNKIVEGD